MALTKKDLSQLERIANTRDEKMMEKISKLMDERMMVFFEQVIARAIDGVVEDVRVDMSKMEERLTKKINIVENNTFRIEKNLDNVTDHHSERIDEHEKRIVSLEGRAVASL